MKTCLIILLICFITGFAVTDIYALLKERNSYNRLFRSFKKILNQFKYEDYNGTTAIFVLKDQFNNVRYKYITDGNFIMFLNHLGEKICSGKIK